MPPKKASNPVPEASNSRDIQIFFVNSRSVKSVLEEVKKFHVDPSGNVKKAVQKLNFAWIKFSGWPHFSVFRVDLISRFFSKTEILSTRNLIHVRYIIFYILFFHTQQNLRILLLTISCLHTVSSHITIFCAGSLNEKWKGVEDCSEDPKNNKHYKL